MLGNVGKCWEMLGNWEDFDKKSTISPWAGPWGEGTSRREGGSGPADSRLGWIRERAPAGRPRATRIYREPGPLAGPAGDPTAVRAALRVAPLHPPTASAALPCLSVGAGPGRADSYPSQPTPCLHTTSLSFIEVSIEAGALPASNRARSPTAARPAANLACGALQPCSAEVQRGSAGLQADSRRAAAGWADRRHSMRS